MHPVFGFASPSAFSHRGLVRFVYLGVDIREWDLSLAENRKLEVVGNGFVVSSSQECFFRSLVSTDRIIAAIFLTGSSRQFFHSMIMKGRGAVSVQYHCQTPQEFISCSFTQQVS